MLHSDSAAKRVAMNMAVSGTTEVGTGMGMRFVGGALTTGGNLKEAWAQAINPQSILFDATLGASMGGVKGLQKPQQINADLNSPEDAFQEGKTEVSEFSATNDKGKALVNQVIADGNKISPEKVIMITQDSSGKIIWLEEGTLNGKPSGLKHIIDMHESDFNSIGIATKDVPDFVLSAVSKGKIIGYQGKGTGRPIYEFDYNGKTYKVAVTVGSNGYIVGANPR